jgi:enoyl-CoA hydratase/carnithine racemase
VSSATDELICSLSDQIGLIRLNRPQFHNAISRSMWNEIPGALDRLQQDGAKVILFTGTGSSFASGADLFELEKIETETNARDQWLSIKQSLDYLWRFPLPTIAMINGPCIGGGCLLSLACDMRFAVENAIFAVPVAKLAIILDDENVFRLSRLVGQGMAAEMLFSASTISGARALAAGLVNSVLPPGELDNHVLSTARMIVANSQQSIQASKRSLRRAVESGCTGNEQEVVGSYLSDDFKNRIKLFLNRS